MQVDEGKQVLEGAAEESFIALEGSHTVGSAQGKCRQGGFLGAIHEPVDISLVDMK